MKAREIDAVIARYRQAFKRTSVDWDATRRPRPTISQHERDAVGQRTLEMLGFEGGTERFLQELMPASQPKDLGFHEVLELLAGSLRNDVAQCLTSDQEQFLETVHFKFLDVGLMNACCIAADVDGQPLDGYIVFLNEGLYFSLMQLFSAVVFEELQGDLLDFRRDGKEGFAQAVDMYLSPSHEKIRPNLGYVGDPEASAEIERHLASATTLVLQFVALHELGHALLGHHDTLSTQRLALAGAEIGAQAEQVWERNHVLEYEADAFAFAALMARTQTIEAHWAHCFLVYLFFRYMAEVERKAGRPASRLHPNPMDRARAIKDLLLQAFPSEFEHAAVLKRADELITKWTS